MFFNKNVSILKKSKLKIVPTTTTTTTTTITTTTTLTVPWSGLRRRQKRSFDSIRFFHSLIRDICGLAIYFYCCLGSRQKKTSPFVASFPIMIFLSDLSIIFMGVRNVREAKKESFLCPPPEHTISFQYAAMLLPPSHPQTPSEQWFFFASAASFSFQIRI